LTLFYDDDGAKLEGFRPKHNDDTLELLEYANHASPDKINLGENDLLEVINVDDDTPITNTVIYLYKMIVILMKRGYLKFHQTI